MGYVSFREGNQYFSGAMNGLGSILGTKTFSLPGSNTDILFFRRELIVSPRKPKTAVTHSISPSPGHALYERFAPRI